MNSHCYDSAVLREIRNLTDEQLLDEFDQVVVNAADGDDRAVGVIAIVYGPALLAEARAVLGPGLQQDGGDVLQTFFLALMERTLTVPRVRGGALAWMKRTVRGFAREHIAELGPDWDLAG
jgi:hypothetical protein